MSETEHVVDFEEIDTLFRHLGLNLDPAECHGALCGLLCATEASQGNAWVNQTLKGHLDLPKAEAAPPQDGDGRTELLIFPVVAGR